MRIFLCLCLLISSNSIRCQGKIISNNADGSLSVLSMNDCSTETYTLNITFADIAMTPNNELYGINAVLYKVDYLNNSYSLIGGILDTNNRTIYAGTGLVALDDHFLLMDYNDSLYRVSTTTAIAYSMGKIGHDCGGDLAILNDTLYMTELFTNNLIKISLNPSKTSILSVVDLGFIKTQLPIYSLFTTYPSCHASDKELFAIEKNNLYKINTQTADATLICSVTNPIIESYGATASFGFDSNGNLLKQLPNIFTPNGDNINDVLNLAICNKILKTTIYNRWGTIVFDTEKENHFWDGRTTSGVECAEGTYFYVITTDEKTYKGYLQLTR